NGVRVQSGNTKNMLYSCRETVSWASRFFPLSPGDLIFTGTPAGVILGKPKGERVWLVPGDTVKVTIDGLGELVTPLI
ncbi:MAG: fumarylacetoacetate hydrolase family protein, partial [Oscillospiraceae bacterium]|nr:fumarylacetoacetate hydrolase family protein [Oscillospiraceae bacterium]